MRKLILVWMFLNITIFFTSIAQSETTWGIFEYDIYTGTTTKLLDSGINPQGLSTDGRYLAYTARSFTEQGSQEHLYVYDTVMNTTRQLTTGTTGSDSPPGGVYGYSYPSVSDGKAVWTTLYSNPGGAETEIVLCDLATGTQEIIVPTPGYRIGAEMSGSRVVWHEGNPARIHALNLSTGESTVINSPSYENARWADVSGDIAVYYKVEDITGNHGVYGFDFTTNQEFSIYSGAAGNPKIDGNWVVFGTDGNGIAAKDLSSGEVITVASLGGHSVIAGDIVVHHDGTGGLAGYNLSSQTSLFSGLGSGFVNNIGNDGYDIAGSKVFFAVMYEIPEPCVLTLTTPNSGEDLPIDTTYNITWESQGSIENVLLEYSIDNGSSWVSIGSVANTGSYEWLVPAEDSCQCRIRISNTTYPADVFDISDEAFCIRPWAYSGGDGSVATPYLISDPNDWQELMVTSADWDSHFLLTVDLDFGGVSLIPVGNDSTYFTGVFDGNGHVLSNFVINQSYDAGVGLFGTIRPGGQVLNLGVENGIVAGDNYVGGLCGWNSGTISQCYTTGSVTGYWNVGGLCGWNSGTISQCYATGGVTGGGWVGGLCGDNGGTVLDSFWDMETSGQTDSSGGTGKTTAEMKNIQTYFDAGWDFVGEITNGTTETWYMPWWAVGYPMLGWQNDIEGHIVYVDVMNMAGPWDGSPEHPYRYIQDGIAACASLGTVTVNPGTYYENVSINKELTLRSTDPNDPNVVAATIIDGQQLGSVITITDSNSIIKGFTITNGLAEKGGGIYCKNSTIVIYDCNISQNRTTDGLDNDDYAGKAGNGGNGGGIYCDSSSIEIQNCVFNGNTTGKGGGNYSGYKSAGNGGNGGGIYCDSSSIEIQNCVFNGNTTGKGGYSWDIGGGKGGNGAGIYCTPLCWLILNNCIIHDNTTGDGGEDWNSQGGAGGDGAGIYCYSAIITNCEISKNRTGNGQWGSDSNGGKGGNGAGIYCISDSNLEVEHCIISENCTGQGARSDSWNPGEGGDGAGLYCSTSKITNSVIRGNCTGDGGGGGGGGHGRGMGGNGGGIFSYSGALNMINCTISDNVTGSGGDGGLCYGGDGGSGAGIFCTSSAMITIVNSTIANNKTGKGGIGTYNYYYRLGGKGGNGGGIFCYSGIIADSIIFGNKTGDGGNAEPIFGAGDGGNGGSGGGIYHAFVTIRNCVISGNMTGKGGSCVEFNEGNSGSGGNGGNGAGIFGTSGSVTNCTVADNTCGTGGTGIRGGNNGVDGLGAGVYADANTVIINTITCHNSSGDLFGADYVNVTFSDICDDNYSGQIGNISCDPYFVDPNNNDYHLKSQAGRWDPNSQSWIYDNVTSPCIDTGDPADPNWMNELWPDGKRINMGAYGGTAEASMSPLNVGNIADLNRDGVVDFEDYGLLANSWLTEQTLLREDLDRDGEVAVSDLSIFAENWLWQENLTACWYFNELSGLTAYDGSGNGHHGTLINGPAWTGTGQLSFDGVDDYVQVPESAALDFSTGLTVSAWVYLQAYGNDWPKVVIKPHTSYADPWEMYTLDLSHYGQCPRFLLSNGVPGGEGAIAADPAYTLQLQQWYHLVGIYDGTAVKLYVNGLEVASTPATFSIGQNDMPLSISSRLGVNPFQGQIDQVRLYDRALSAAEVEQLYQQHE